MTEQHEPLWKPEVKSRPGRVRISCYACGTHHDVPYVAARNETYSWQQYHGLQIKCYITAINTYRHKWTFLSDIHLDSRIHSRCQYFYIFCLIHKLSALQCIHRYLHYSFVLWSIYYKHNLSRGHMIPSLHRHKYHTMRRSWDQTYHLNTLFEKKFYMYELYPLNQEFWVWVENVFSLYSIHCFVIFCCHIFNFQLFQGIQGYIQFGDCF